jgi:DNA mismatch repair protein MutS
VRRDAHGDLFAATDGANAAAPEAPAALERLAALDPDALSPREAQATLYELKRLLGK